MPPKRVPREYRGHACHRCHTHKVKCSRGKKPCRNCTIANTPCTYADRKVTVRESYLNQLRKAAIAGDKNHNVSSQPERVAKPAYASSSSSAAPLVENSTAELFVSKLREIQKSRSLLGSPPKSQSEDSGESSRHGLSKPYEYIALSFDTLPYTDLKCTFRLPPYPYAVYLLEQFTTYIGYDWHWFRVRSFRECLEATYKIPNSPESRDRIWLCQLLVVFALSEAFNGETGAVEISTDSDQPFPSEDAAHRSAQTPPGMDFFEQALKLWKVPYEEISAEHIQVLNLIALYSYSLNRQRTAYMYAGSSSRMCNVLQLHKKSASANCTPVEREHLKRLWWSTFCIDRMASTQMGLLPSLQIDQIDIEYPSQDELLLPEEAVEFSDPDLLTARAQLTIIQDVNANKMSQVEPDGEYDIETIILPAMQRLEVWKEKLPSHLILDSESHLPYSNHMPFIRAFANLHLRYNQCMVLLLRPLLLKQIAHIFSGEERPEAPEMVAGNIKDACLQSARSNVRLLVLLKSRGLLVWRGFMENMHLFSSLMVMCLAMAIHTRHPHSFSVKSDDSATYAAGKDVLRDMIRSGSLPAREHERMLEEVQGLAERIAIASEAPLPTVIDEWDADEWMTQLLEGGNITDDPNIF